MADEGGCLWEENPKKISKSHECHQPRRLTAVLPIKVHSALFNMTTQPPQTVGLSGSEQNNTQTCQPASKWMATVNDNVVYAPSRNVKVTVLKSQAGIASDHILVRDHGSGQDVAFGDEDILNLGEGNVFVTMPRCEHQPRGGCAAPAKLAWFIDDHPEITLRTEQSGRSLRELFGLTVAVRLFRDLESSNDESVGLDAVLRFTDGPVFYSRRSSVGLTITVNKQTFGTQDGVKPEMTGREIGNLITPEPCEVKRLTKGHETDVPLNSKLKIEGCEEFKVIRCNVIGGYEQARVDREMAVLRENGAVVDFITVPQPAVIYRQVPTRPGYAGIAETDVLVTLPSAFPAVMLDGAYLPQGSPLLGKVAGQPAQGILQSDGRVWELVSYHPHNGGGGPVWNPNHHGIHSYYSEVLTWIQRAN
jgi:hypothetical protein